MIYTYDSTFEGLLTAVYEAYYRRENPEKILPGNYLQHSLLDQVLHIPTDPEKAGKVYDSIRTKISGQALEHVYYAYLSDFDDAGTCIYQYLKLGWKMGRRIDSHLSDDRVLKIHNMSYKVGGEKHRMLGLLRFRQLSGELYYAPMEPTYNILPIVAPHFSERLADQNWVIHDVKRRLAAVYNKRSWVLTELDANQYMAGNDDELIYQDLWKRYFESIAIRSRVNPRLQRQHMPKKYWKYLVEKNG